MNGLLIKTTMSTNIISNNEIKYHPLSGGDRYGKLFQWKGELYRAIPEHCASFYQKLFAKGIAQKLIEKRMIIDTQITEFRLEGYALILKHKKISSVSYYYEWSSEMLKEAALLTVDLNLELAKYGLHLQDSHPWNILFDGINPYHVDFTSIRPILATDFFPQEEFCRFFLRPLKLMSMGHHHIARSLMRSDLGVSKNDFLALSYQIPFEFDLESTRHTLTIIAKKYLPQELYLNLKNYLQVSTKNLSSGNFESLKPNFLDKVRKSHLKRIRRRIEAIRLSNLKTEWSNYYDEEFPEFSASDQWTQKHYSTSKVLSDLMPISVLDIGSNRGWYSQFAASLGSRVVAFDVDETSVSKLYFDAKKKELHILPLIMSFCHPSPGYGIANSWAEPAIERLSCNMVLALALVHHLVFKQLLTFDQIALGLSKFSTKWVLVEFIPREDQYVKLWWTENFGWYTLDNFILSLRVHFLEIQVLESHPSPRKLLICTKHEE